MPRGQNAAPTVEQISKDRITLVSVVTYEPLLIVLFFQSSPNNIGHRMHYNDVLTIV